VKSEGLATLLRIGRGGIGGFEISLWLRCRPYTLEDQPPDKERERDVRFGSSAYRLLGEIVKRVQGVRKRFTALWRGRVCFYRDLYQRARICFFVPICIYAYRAHG
jgi:hypothetical protein